MTTATTDSEIKRAGLPAVGSPVERMVRRVRINVGALVSQDQGVGRWPANAAGDDVDPDMEFDAEWNGRWWDCRADGYGRRSWLGEGGGYGNGSIFVFAIDGVTPLDEPSNAEVQREARPPNDDETTKRHAGFSAVTTC